MAQKDKRALKQPASKQPVTEQDTEKGYGGSGDYATGKVPADTSQATPEQLREDRARQRTSDVETDAEE